MKLAGLKAWLRKRTLPFLNRSSQQAKRLITGAWSYVQNNRKLAVTVAAIAIVAASATAYGKHYYTSNLVTVYHVIVNGKEIGTVSSPDVVKQWALDKLKQESQLDNLSLNLADYISFREEQIFKGTYDDEAALATLSREANIRVDAVKILVDGKVVGYAANQQDANAVLDRLKAKFGGAVEKLAVTAASLESDAGATVKDVRFKENVVTQAGTVPAAQVLSVDKLEELLTKGTVKQVIHTVQEGDCITCIAKKYGITSKDIYANNPGITEDTVLQLGQEINVTANRPLVTVQVTEEVEQNEAIPYQVETRTNSQLPKGETKVIQQGKEGQKRVRYELVKENGQVVERKVIDQKILSEPVNKIVERGTKVIPSRGTGRLGWPASGYISSGFGQRWGRLHAGIDIAGSGNIRAADNGRVVSAGWNGNYGKCVIIDHGNGLQTLYGHMRSINVKVGQVVQKGQVIGIMGATGQATGVHVHFEVRKNGRPQNPMLYLR